jgi:PadR family transcriptional regulator, regulatory protein PadR
VARGSGFSAQTLLVLEALVSAPADWRHGYDLARQTGLKSGTLYPILVRLADRGLVEACWEEGRPAGRPPRHLYRLTSEGLASAQTALAQTALARTALATAPAASPHPVPPRRPVPRRGPAGEGLAGEAL